MPEILIKKVENDKMLMDFIKFPMKLYKNNKCYVPPLIRSEKETWNPQENPALAYSEAELYLAYRDGDIVGRIALIVNHKEAKELGIHKVRFGEFDFIDDKEVSAALINQAKKFAADRNLHKVEGPMGFTNLDKAGMLTMGFERVATMIGIYNYSYYPEHMESLGFQAEKEWVEYELQFPEKLDDKILRFNELIKTKYHLKTIQFKKKQDILPYVKPMFKLLDETYKALSTYTPLTEQQIETYKEKYFRFIDKDFIVCVVDDTNRLVAFAVTIPSYAEALQKANGRLFPFGWWHFLKATKHNKRAGFYLIGIHPDLQRHGITAIIFKEIYDVFKKKGVKYLETNPELIENKNIQSLWQAYNPTNHKRRKTFSKEF